MSATNRIQTQTPFLNLNLAYKKAGRRRSRLNPPTPRVAETNFPLGMVLDACPDIIDYAKDGISNWRDFVATAAMVRAMLGVSPSAWEEAQTIMGERQAATVIAAILQRAEAIVSAGGYLRDLTRKAEAGEFSLGPMLMALIGRSKAREESARECRAGGGARGHAARTDREARSRPAGFRGTARYPRPARRVRPPQRFVRSPPWPRRQRGGPRLARAAPSGSARSPPRCNRRRPAGRAAVVGLAHRLGQRGTPRLAASVRQPERRPCAENSAGSSLARADRRLTIALTLWPSRGGVADRPPAVDGPELPAPRRSPPPLARLSGPRPAGRRGRARRARGSASWSARAAGRGTQAGLAAPRVAGTGSRSTRSSNLKPAIPERGSRRKPRPAAGGRGALVGEPAARAGGVAGVCVLRYDNEAGKGDHRHVGDVETEYRFTTPDQLLADFWRDVDQWRPE